MTNVENNVGRSDPEHFQNYIRTGSPTSVTLDGTEMLNMITQRLQGSLSIVHDIDIATLRVGDLYRLVFLQVKHLVFRDVMYLKGSRA